MELLILLVERHGELVSREEIADHLWGKEVFVDVDHSINVAIRKVRAALRDDPEKPHFVETVVGRGYRFAAPVKQAGENGAGTEAPTLLSSVQTSLAGSELPSHARRWNFGLVAFGLVALVLMVAAGIWAWRLRHRAVEPRPGRVMLAVLPFQNLSGDTAQEYVSDGLTEEMISQLGNLDSQHLGVIARTSVMRYKNTQTPLIQIGRELGVQYVIEGSVRRESDRVRISAQLIKMKDQSHLWARQYDRELKDLLAVQSEIAQEIADEIQLTFGDHPLNTANRIPAASTSYETYNLYLKALYFWNLRTPEGMQQAANYFQQAIAKDPNYAAAYAGLANTFSLTADWELGPQSDLMPKARAAALKALQLNDALAEGHAALAMVADSYDYDWQTAEKELRRAIELNPNYATAHQWLSVHFSLMGRFDEALAEVERARQLDPQSLTLASNHAEVLLALGQTERALAECRDVLDMDASFTGCWDVSRDAYLKEGRFQGALDYVNKYIRPRDPAEACLAEIRIYGEWGRREEVKLAVARFQDAVRDSPYRDLPADRVQIYIAMGQKDQAIALLQKAFEEHSALVTSLKSDTIYDSMRSDPRFQDLLRRLQFPE